MLFYSWKDLEDSVATPLVDLPFFVRNTPIYRVDSLAKKYVSKYI
jgi:hypothetical protein